MSFIPVISHYSSLQCHMILQKSYMLILCSRDFLSKLKIVMLPNIFVETVIHFCVDMTYSVSNKFYVPNKGKNTVPKSVKLNIFDVQCTT